MGKKTWGQVVRGSFHLGDGDKLVLVSSTGDFIVNVIAQNKAANEAGIQLTTPASHYRSSAVTEEQDGILLAVPAATSLSLGAIGGAAEETLEFSALAGTSVTVFFTVTTSKRAKVSMVALPQREVTARVKKTGKRKLKAKQNQDSLKA